MMPGGSVLIIRHCRRFLLAAVHYATVEKHASVTFIAMLIWFVTLSLVYEIKNKFYHRKSMQAADKKLISNELGPNC